MKFYPEGHLIDTFENRAAMQSPASLSEAMRDGTILEARAVMCDSKHNLIVDFKFMKGIIPREEGAIGIKDGTVRDIAIISRVNRPVCFQVQDFIRDEYGRITALLSRRAAQEKCREEYILNRLEFLSISAAASFHCFLLIPSPSHASNIHGNVSWWEWISVLSSNPETATELPSLIKNYWGPGKKTQPVSGLEKP